MYKPKMIAVSTTCMAEVIGDDLNAFIKTAKEKGSVPAEYDVPFAHTPAFVGSHVTGYDNAMKGVLEHFWDGKAGTAPKLERQPNEKINFLGGFDGYTVGNLREIKRIFNLMGVEYTILGDNSDVWDTPTDGEFRMYDGGTTLEEAANAVHAKATISMQEFCTEKTLPFIANHGQEVVGVQPPDRRCRHRQVPDGSLAPHRQGDPRGARPRAWPLGRRHRRLRRAHPRQEVRDLRRSRPHAGLGLASFLLELGAEPTTVLSTNGGKTWAAKVQKVFDSSPFGQNCKVYPNKDCGTCGRCSSRSRWTS